MGKVLIAAFDDKDEIAFDELLLFLKSNSHIKVVNAFPNDSCLKYDNLIIDSKYRMVEADGKSIELTNYEFEILYLLARHPGQVFSKEQIYNQVWKEPNSWAITTVWGIGYKFNNAIKRK